MGNTPVGEVPMPPVPVLDEDAPDRPMTMAEAATRQRADQHAQDTGGIFQRPSSMPKLLPTDLLAEEARGDPQFIRGHGDMLAINQPVLALKYGIVRGGKVVTPQELQHNIYPPAQGVKQLRPETLEGLQQLEELQKASQNQEAEAEREAKSGVGGAAERLAGDPAGPATPVEPDQATREKMADTIQRMDDFEFDSFRQMMMRDLLNNEQQRKIIEERLQPMSIDEIFVNGTLRQTVPIIEGRLWVEFESVTGDIELALKSLISAEARTLDVSERYYLDKYSMMALVAGIRSINGKPMPLMYNEKGEFSQEAFLIKFNKISKFPLPMLASLAVNYFWFDVRGRKLFVAEKIKNGS